MNNSNIVNKGEYMQINTNEVQIFINDRKCINSNFHLTFK